MVIRRARRCRQSPRPAAAVRHTQAGGDSPRGGARLLGGPLRAFPSRRIATRPSCRRRRRCRRPSRRSSPPRPGRERHSLLQPAGRVDPTTSCPASPLPMRDPGVGPGWRCFSISPGEIRRHPARQPAHGRDQGVDAGMATCTPNSFNGSLGRLDIHVAPDDQCALAREGQRQLSRPMLPPVPVMTHTLPDSLDATQCAPWACAARFSASATPTARCQLRTSRKYQ